MKRIAVFASGLILTTAALLHAAEPEPQVRAEAAAGRLTLEMRKKLVPALQKGGPVGAMDICAKEAPALITDLEKTFNLTMKRTALRVRNPKNAPDPLEKALLEKLETMQKQGEPVPQDATLYSDQKVSKKERELRYYKVMSVQAPCLLCHGAPETMSADVKKFLAERYPNDKAVGYKAGDLRGIISISIREPLPEEDEKK